MFTRFSLAVAAIVLVSPVLSASEHKIQKKDLPPAVQQAVENELQGGTVKGYARETENGKTFYEVETTKNGLGRDLLFDPEGKLVEVEEEVAVDSLPAAAKQALTTGHGTLVRVEAVTENGTTIYEGHFKGGKQSEVKVTADGKPVTNK
jgi:uncharacterized membrane protein YkoI